MRKNIWFCFLSFTLLLVSTEVSAQQYEHFEVSSGFTADVIADGVGMALLSSSIGVDGANHAFLSTDFQADTTSPIYPNALPVNGLINTIAAGTPGLSFQLNPYSESNSLRLTTASNNGTLEFSNPMQALSIFILGTSADGSSDLSGTVNFTDGSTQIFTGTMPDWYNLTTLPVAVWGIGRVHRVTQAVDTPANNPRMYQWQVIIDDVNLTKTIESVSFTKTSATAGIAHIFAVSANALGDCPYPVEITVTSSTSEAVDLSWIPIGEETQWEVAVVPQGSPVPTSGTIVNTPEYSAEGLNPVSPYTIYVRAVCNEDEEEYSSWVQYTFYTPIGNDNCATPVELTVDAGEICAVSETVSFVGATVSPEDPVACGTNNGGDVWYSFTADEPVHIVQLRNFSNLDPFLPIALTLYEGECDELTQLICSTVNYITATGLTPGNTYLIRVSLNTTTTNLSETFDICVTTPDLSGGGSSFECLINTINWDFEEPVISQTTGWPTFVHHNTVQGWRTTASDGIIEIWPNTTNGGGTTAYSGNQYIELNANMVSGVYQDFDTPVTTTFNFGFAHRGRQGTDTCGLYTGPPGGPYELVFTASTGTSGWQYYTGTYTVPEGQTQTRFIFEAISTSSGDPTVGNFLDAITFTANNGILSENPVSLDCSENTVDLILAAGVGVWTAHDDNPAPTTISNSSSNTPVITGFTLEGTYRYEWTTLYCSSTLEIYYTGTDVPNPVAENVIYCVGQQAVALEATILNDHTINWYTEETGGEASPEAPVPDTSVSGVTTYYVSQTSDISGCESLRTAIIVTVNDPAPLEIIGFEYEFDQYCISTNTILPQLSIITPLGGTFSITGGFPINPETGAINLADVSEGTYTVTYTLASDIENCIAESSTNFEITFVDSQSVETGFSYPTPVCTSEGNLLPVLNEGFISGSVFQSDGGLVIDPTTGEINVSNSDTGTYTITYTIQEDTENCIALSTGAFTFTILEESDYKVYQQCEGANTWLYVEDDNQNDYIWYNANGSVVHSGANSFNVSEYLVQNSTTIPNEGLLFTVTVDDGCESTASYLITSAFCNIPKGISPNGDYLNDNFDLTGLGVNYIGIFNRYGTLVYDFKGDYTKQWEGQSNNGNELPSGTYYYAITTIHGETLTGWVYIQREL